MKIRWLCMEKDALRVDVSMFHRDVSLHVLSSQDEDWQLLGRKALQSWMCNRVFTRVGVRRQVQANVLFARELSNTV